MTGGKAGEPVVQEDAFEQLHIMLPVDYVPSMKQRLQ